MTDKALLHQGTHPQAAKTATDKGTIPSDNQSQSSVNQDTTEDDNPDSQEPVQESIDFALSQDESYYIVTGIGTYSKSILTIPQVYKDKPVKEIAEGAFLEYGEVYYVTVPLSVETIRKNAFGDDLPVFLMHSSPAKGFEDGWIQNTDNCYWYSEEMPLTESFFDESCNYWNNVSLPEYWGVYTKNYLLTDNNMENIISVYTQYATQYLNLKNVTADSFNFYYDGTSIGPELIVFTSPETSLKKFESIHVGMHFSDVFKLDPFLGNYPWFRASYTEFPHYSIHRFKQGFYRIDYNEDYVITGITKILPETN